MFITDSFKFHRHRKDWTFLCKLPKFPICTLDLFGSPATKCVQARQVRPVWDCCKVWGRVRICHEIGRWLPNIWNFPIMLSTNTVDNLFFTVWIILDREVDMLWNYPKLTILTSAGTEEALYRRHSGDGFWARTTGFLQWWLGRNRMTHVGDTGQGTPLCSTRLLGKWSK